MRHWIFSYRWPLAVTIVLIALLAIVSTTVAQPPVPHAVMEGEDCLSCHQTGVADAPRVAWDHLGRNNEDCAHCHKVSGLPAGEIPHPLIGREDCTSCHSQGVGNTPQLTGNHVDYANNQCEQCHFVSAAAAEPTPIPAAPTPAVETIHTPTSGSSCTDCHQLIFADEEHALFTGQPMGNAEVGAALFTQVCASCHGEDGTTPVGDESIINAETYWGTRDDATILQDIGAGTHGQMTAFAQDYDGPLTWEEILDIMAHVRSWGPMAPLSGTSTGESPTFTNDIGPLLTERCGACHGSSAGLSVTDYDALMAGSSSGPVIVPGDSSGSKIVEIQRGAHYAQLSTAELDRLIKWITDKAPEQ